MPCEYTEGRPGAPSCGERFSCCDCGGHQCGCIYCWSCQACDACLNEEDA